MYILIKNLITFSFWLTLSLAAPVSQRNSHTEAGLGGGTNENSFDKRAENLINVNIDDDLDLKDKDDFYNTDFAYDIDMPYDEEDFFTKNIVATKINNHNNDADKNDKDYDVDGNDGDDNENDEDDDDERFFYYRNAQKTRIIRNIQSLPPVSYGFLVFTCSTAEQKTAKARGDDDEIKHAK
eukprot:Awhi_evm1s14224